jgi:hypothetical protein
MNAIRPSTSSATTHSGLREGRNAWRDLWLLAPGETKWKRASLRRHQIEKQGVLPPVTPAESMATAAEAMSAALKAALALVEHSNAQLARKYERRINRARRADDYLADACQLD